MKTTILAKFFNELSRQIIPFSVDEVHNQTFEDAFGIKFIMEEEPKKADGIYLQVWAEKNSLSDDFVSEFLDKNMHKEFMDGSIEVCNAPTNDEDHNEWLYIIKIID